MTERLVEVKSANEARAVDRMIADFDRVTFEHGKARLMLGGRALRACDITDNFMLWLDRVRPLWSGA
jgi:hypothetical protein